MEAPGSSSPTSQRNCSLVALVALTFLGAQGAAEPLLRPPVPQGLAAQAVAPVEDLPEDAVALLAMMIHNRSLRSPPSKPITSKAGPLLVKLTRKRGQAVSAAAAAAAAAPTSSSLADSAARSWQDSAYVANLFLGSPTPQHLRVAFDTASGQVVLPSSRCSSLACQERQRYAPRASSTAVDVNGDGEPVWAAPGAKTIKRDAITIGVSSLDHGHGKAVGDLVREKICLGKATAEHCLEMGLVAATEMSDVPFRAMPQDGVVGLGMSALTANPLFHLLSRLQPWPAFSQSFGLFLDANGGELAFGGANPAKLLSGTESSLKWAPVLHPEEGYWQLSIHALRVGNTTLACSSESDALSTGCRGILDSSASGIGTPDLIATKLLAALGGQQSCGGPRLALELDGGVELELLPQDYRSVGSCEPMLLPASLPKGFENVFILGQPWFRKHYTVFDWGNKKIGFGPPAGSGTDEILAKEAATVQRSNHQAAAMHLSNQKEAPGLDEDDQVKVLTTDEAEALEKDLILADLRAQEAADKSRWSKSLFMDARTLGIFMLQGLMMQALVLLLLMLAGSPRSEEQLHTRIILARLSSVVFSRLGFKVPGSRTLTSSFLMAQPLKDAETPEASECVVCLGSREEELSSCKARPPWCKLRCGHAFHQDCIFEWLHKAQRCPICRCHVIEDEKTSAVTTGEDDSLQPPEASIPEPGSPSNA
eukprot:TRINITY_DN4981_c0_g1_i1.p1 TRINITY_DN4981_c0_g1~~TRINITY_DN4981_c0_g1_i1.p1  ORF type:complete len:709 (-),score=144.83 TRINITY_DN4981_c0_g1_i1:188-2314(-)